GRTGWRGYLLGGLDADTLAEAIALPTAREPIPYAADIPFEKYGFAYDDGLAEGIARDALEAGSAGGESPLPVVQVVCEQLFETARARPDQVGHNADVRALGGVEGALQRYVQAVIDSQWPGRRDKRAVRALLERLYRRRPDGIIVRSLVPETELAEGWGGSTP